MEYLNSMGGASYEINRKNRGRVFAPVTEEAFSRACGLLETSGFLCREVRAEEGWRYAAFQKEDKGVFLNYFEGIRELRAVEEEDCAYFSFEDRRCEACVSPQITQIALEDFGMSYAVRLSDGRFLVLDGGWNFAPDAEKLYRCLLRGSGGARPVIAAWILTHPHRDHYQCFIGFHEAFGDRVTVETVILSFPEADNPAYESDFTYRDFRVPDSDERSNIPRLWECIAACGARVCTAHTGQQFRIGDSDCRILSSPDDTVDRTASVNAMSLVVRMELGGQVILWTADCAFSLARLPERFGSGLKADILQVPHHGFLSGTVEGEIRGYDLIGARVALLPVSDYNAYVVFCAHRENMRHLMLNCGLEELIAGSGERTLTLPYTPLPYGKAELLRCYEEGQMASGRKCWIFTGLSTACPGDFVFDFLNTTHIKATVTAELFFDDPKKKIRHIRFPVLATRNTRVNTVGDGVDSEGVWFNEFSLKKQGIPENVSFSIRFLSDVALVISHPDHSPALKEI